MSTAAEARQARNAPSRSSNPRSGILLGTLDEMVIETPQGLRRMGRRDFRGAHLAWLPSKRNFAIVYSPRNGTSANVLSEAIVRKHVKFHGVRPKSAVQYEWPNPQGPMRKLGLIKSLTYSIPASLDSPGKKGIKWVHAFGDHGESGHGPHVRTKDYPQHFKPEAKVDRKGRVFIGRRPGNRYDVTDWIFW